MKICNITITDIRHLGIRQPVRHYTNFIYHTIYKNILRIVNFGTSDSEEITSHSETPLIVNSVFKCYSCKLS